MPEKSLTEEEKLILNPLGKAIDYYRKRKGMSSSRLARETGLSRPTISSIINGKRNPSYLTLRCICNVLEIPRFVLDMFLADLSNDDLQYWYQNTMKLRIYRSTALDIDLDTEIKTKFVQGNK